MIPNARRWNREFTNPPVPVLENGPCALFLERPLSGNLIRRHPISITRNPAILSGEPVFRGTRVPFKSIIDYREHGKTLSEFLEDFPSVSRSDAIAALEEGQS